MQHLFFIAFCVWCVFRQVLGIESISKTLKRTFWFGFGTIIGISFKWIVDKIEVDKNQTGQRHFFVLLIELKFF